MRQFTSKNHQTLAEVQRKNQGQKHKMKIGKTKLKRALNCRCKAKAKQLCLNCVNTSRVQKFPKAGMFPWEVVMWCALVEQKRDAAPLRLISWLTFNLSKSTSSVSNVLSGYHSGLSGGKIFLSLMSSSTDRQYHTDIQPVPVGNAVSSKVM